MNTPDDREPKQAAANDVPTNREGVPAEKPDQNGLAGITHAPWSRRAGPGELGARRQQFDQLSEAPTEANPVIAPDTRSTLAGSSLTLSSLATRRFRWRGGRKNRLQDWQSWSKFRLWRKTRPLWGSLLMISAGAIMLVGAIFFLSLAFLVQSIWPAFLIGSLLLVMGLIPLFLPSYAVVTGSIGIVLSLASLLVASFGGCGLGLLLGVIGSALSIAWQPVKRSRLTVSSNS